MSEFFKAFAAPCFRRKTATAPPTSANRLMIRVSSFVRRKYTNAENRPSDHGVGTLLLAGKIHPVRTYRPTCRPMRTYRRFIFDLDGTLTDSIPCHPLRATRIAAFRSPYRDSPTSPTDYHPLRLARLFPSLMSSAGTAGAQPRRSEPVRSAECKFAGASGPMSRTVGPRRIFQEQLGGGCRRLRSGNLSAASVCSEE